MNSNLARAAILGAALWAPIAAIAQSAGPIGIVNERAFAENLVTGGQPTAAQLRTASERGVRTVISLRGAGEPGAEGEAEMVEALGMRFVNIPISSAADLSEAKALALVEALAATDEPVLLHCGSGNRVGAMLALKAFYVNRQAPDAALVEGRRGGLTGLESPVRQRMAGECGARADLSC